MVCHRRAQEQVKKKEQVAPGRAPVLLWRGEEEQEEHEQQAEQEDKRLFRGRVFGATCAVCVPVWLKGQCRW